MLRFKKHLLVNLFCFIIISANAQGDSAVKLVTIDLGKEYKISVKPLEEGVDYLRYISTFLPILVIIGSVWGILSQINARRKDDRLKNQLDRLNKQISDFYGPLLSLYETGDQNYYIYLKHFGKDVNFKNPNFKNWSCAAFQPTNLAMENVIINKADLILGKKIPSCLLQFCEWSATIKVYTQAEKQRNFDADRWQLILDDIKHPETNMQAYLRASFEVLKEEQSSLLSGSRNYVDEEVLIEKIKDRIKNQIELINSEPIINGKTREEIWKEVNSNPPLSQNINSSQVSFKEILRKLFTF